MSQSSCLGMSEEAPAVTRWPYIVVLSGTHVTGKETIAISLSASLKCPWIKGEHVHISSLTAAKSQAKRGYDHSTVYSRIWMKKMRRIGLMAEVSETTGSGRPTSPGRPNSPLRTTTPALKNFHTGARAASCLALVTIYALRKPERDAIREVMRAQDAKVRVIHVIMQITADTLSGRTLGAEEPSLAARIMAEKMEDAMEPREAEKDVLVIDCNEKNVEALRVEMEDRIRRLVAVVVPR